MAPIAAAAMALATLLAPVIAAPAAGAALRATAPHAASVRPNGARADWLATITRTPSGAFVLGNPAAKVRVVEYLSYSCSHCAAFDAEGVPALRAAYIATGRVSLEVRHALRDPFDTAAAMLARCDPSRFFAISHAIFARQESWLARATGYTPPVPPPASDAAALAGVARFAGFDAIAAEQGLAPARQGACLASRPELDRLGAMRQEAWTTRAIGGTPAFFINGVDANTTAWAQLEPKLKAALR